MNINLFNFIILKNIIKNLFFLILIDFSFNDWNKNFNNILQEHL